MVEEKKETISKEEIKPEVKPEVKPVEEKPVELSPIEQANKILEKIEKIKAEVDVSAAKQQEAAARMLLSGKADAGSNVTPEQAAEAKMDKSVKENIEKYL